MMEWQGMETAPRDGSAIWLTDGNYEWFGIWDDETPDGGWIVLDGGWYAPYCRPINPDIQLTGWRRP